MHIRGRKIWWAVGIAAVALLLAAITVRLAFDKTRVIELIQSRAKHAVARDLVIGDLSLQLVPLPALVARRVTLSNPDWARERNLLEADSITAHLNLLPMLGGQLVVSSIAVDGLKANPEIASDGRKSWDFPRGTSNTGASALPINPQNITAVRVRAAQINFIQRGQARQWDIQELAVRTQPGWRNAQLEARITRNSHDMQLKGHFDDLSRIGVKGALSQASMQVQWGQAQLNLVGQIPLESGLEGMTLKAGFRSQSLDDLLGFFAIKNGTVAPISAGAAVRMQQGWIKLDDLAVKLGDLAVTGNLKFNLTGTRPQFDGKLSTPRLDWARALSDAGRPPLPPKPPGELFRTHPLAWALLAAMEGVDGKLDAQIRSLVLRSGVEIKEARADMTFKGDRAQVSRFSGNLLGGVANGSAQLEGRRKTIRVELEADGISLGEWLAERESKLALTGGPMKINASFTASGASMKELAASLTGPVNVQIGPAKIQSQKMQEAETLLIGLAPMLSAKEANEVNLACAGLRLPFSNGRAEGVAIAGARSDVSQLLTTGYIDLREQTLDLRGRVKARSGVSLGISTLAGGVKIAGRIVHPEVGMDPAGTPGILARLGAAIATGGASLLVTSIWDAANPASDPCQIVFAKPARPAARTAPEKSVSAESQPQPAGP
jgi:uncharacterized protein involved in outer membrane biogenesis